MEAVKLDRLRERAEKTEDECVQLRVITTAVETFLEDTIAAWDKLDKVMETFVRT